MRTRVALVVTGLLVVVRVLIPEGGVTRACALPRDSGSERGAPGRLLYARNGRGAPALYAMDPDGSDARPIALGGRAALSTSHLVLGSARWSPDGTRVAWENHRWLRKEVFVAPAEGGRAHAVTDNDVQDNLVGWTPDGRSLLVGRVSSPAGVTRPAGVHLVRADGSKERRISPAGVRGFAGAEVAPTGRVLVVEPSSTTWSRLYTIDPPWRTAKLAMKMRYAPWSRGASLSPDGTRFAQPFVAVDLRNGERRLITYPDPRPEWQQTYSPAAWSPGGERIAYFRTVETGGEGEPFTYDTSVVVTTPRADCFEKFDVPRSPDRPVWSPDGTRIAFSMTAARGRNADIFVLDVETGEVVNVTRSPGAAEHLGDWR